jgi:DNA-binding transcriptional ArsR family regulator
MARVGGGKGGEVFRERIEGGYRRLSVAQLCMGWTLYARGRISRRDLRVWFACHEVEERRCLVERGGKVSFTAEEIGRVAGGLGPADVRAGLRALETVNLLQARKARMRFARMAGELLPEDAPAAEAMLARITNRRRVIRVPRRLVRALAAGMSKATTAVVIAHLMRCVYFHAAKRRYRVDGRCKASWIAETFGVSERAVVTARRKLIDGGLLIVLESPQWQLNRYGLRLAVDLGYPQRPGKGTEQSASPPARSAGRTADPGSNSTLLRKNRTLAPRAGIGVRKRTTSERYLWPGRLQVADLVEPDRLDAVRRRLVARGALGDGDADKLKLAAAASRALRVGQVNPCGLFYALVRDGLWHHASQLDEKAGRRSLARHLDSDTVRAEDSLRDLLASVSKRVGMPRV